MSPSYIKMHTWAIGCPKPPLIEQVQGASVHYSRTSVLPYFITAFRSHSQGSYQRTDQKKRDVCSGVCKELFRRENDGSSAVNQVELDVLQRLNPPQLVYSKPCNFTHLSPFSFSDVDSDHESQTVPLPQSKTSILKQPSRGPESDTHCLTYLQLQGVVPGAWGRPFLDGPCRTLPRHLATSELHQLKAALVLARLHLLGVALPLGGHLRRRLRRSVGGLGARPGQDARRGCSKWKRVMS
jgi:hypothetical protein